MSSSARKVNQLPLILADLDIGILFVLAVSSLGVYGIVLAGWSSNSKYPFLGGIRSSAQMISYELAMGLSLLPVFLWVSEPGATASSLSLVEIVRSQNASTWLLIIQPVSALIFLIALFAETNRLPFDMPESETDLVGGFHTEYGSFKFGIFFVAEYAHIVIGSAIFTLLFSRRMEFSPLGRKPMAFELARIAYWNCVVFDQDHWTDFLFYMDSMDASSFSIRSGDAFRLD